MATWLGHSTQLCSQILFWMVLWGCFWMRFLSKLLGFDWSRWSSIMAIQTLELYRSSLYFACSWSRNSHSGKQGGSWKYGEGWLFRHKPTFSFKGRVVAFIKWGNNERFLGSGVSWSGHKNITLVAVWRLKSRRQYFRILMLRWWLQQTGWETIMV